MLAAQRIENVTSNGHAEVRRQAGLGWVISLRMLDQFENRIDGAGLDEVRVLVAIQAVCPTGQVVEVPLREFSRRDRIAGHETRMQQCIGMCTVLIAPRIQFEASPSRLPSQWARHFVRTLNGAQGRIGRACYSWTRSRLPTLLTTGMPLRMPSASWMAASLAVWVVSTISAPGTSSPSTTLSF